jgi:hypothetical protein
MATQGIADQHPDAEQESPVAAPAKATPGAPAGEAAAVEPPAQSAADIVAAPLAVIEEAAQTARESVSATFEFDATLWSKKSFELWSENASAFLDLAERIVTAKSFEEILDLQSRFASARFEAFVRQSQELMGFTQGLAALAAAPLRDASKKAA